jgi:hypothetical protein
MQIIDKEINGATWKTRELDGDTALTLALEIMQVVGPALAAAGKGHVKGKGVLEQEINIEAVISELMKNFSTDKAKKIINSMLSETWKMEQREHGMVETRCAQHFKTLFAGKRLTKDLIPVLRFVFEENFGGFSGLSSITGP